MYYSTPTKLGRRAYQKEQPGSTATPPLVRQLGGIYLEDRSVHARQQVPCSFQGRTGRALKLPISQITISQPRIIVLLRKVAARECSPSNPTPEAGAGWLEHIHRRHNAGLLHLSPFPRGGACTIDPTGPDTSTPGVGLQLPSPIFQSSLPELRSIPSIVITEHAEKLEQLTTGSLTHSQQGWKNA